jgi:hypothetical protein
MNKRYSFILLSSILTACGGGGDSGGASVASITKQPTAVVSQPSNISSIAVKTQPAITEISLQQSKTTNSLETANVIKSAAQSTHDIAVPDGFTLNSERLFNFNVARSEDDNQPAYLSLCSDYQRHDDGSYTINYNSCLLRTSLTELNFEAVITVTNDTQGLVAALWYMDENKPPLITDWRF